MQFISAGASKLQDKIELACKRMFLFSDDVAIPDIGTTAKDIVSIINASRSFCAKVDSDGSMKCVRAAGWKSNRLYYNFVPSVVTTRLADTVAATKTISFFDLFSRYYSVGREGTGSIYSGICSLLETEDNALPTAPVDNCMVLPAFDGSAVSVGLNTAPNTTLTQSSSRSWSNTTSLGIVTSRVSETVNTFMTYVQVTAVDTANDKVTVQKTVSALSGNAYATGAGPRLFASFTQTSTVSKSPYSESVISSTTTNTVGPRMSTTDVSDTNLLYGTGSHANTDDYALTWAMMPIAGDDFMPLIAVVLKADKDFTQQGLVSPGTKPVLALNAVETITIKNKFIV